MKSLTTTASLPSGAGCSSAPPPEVVERPAPATMPAAPQPEPTITMETMAALGRSLDRMRSRAAAQRQGFEPFDYAERN